MQHLKRPLLKQAVFLNKKTPPETGGVSSIKKSGHVKAIRRFYIQSHRIHCAD